VCSWIALFVAIGGLACKRTEGKGFAMRRIDTDIGLSLEVPEECQVAKVGSDLRVFSAKRERSRSPMSIVLTLVDKPPQFPEAKANEVAHQMINYVVTDEPGGSGGEALRLKAWVESNGRFVVLDSVVQPDSGGDAEFSVEWAILPTLRWRAGG